MKKIDIGNYASDSLKSVIIILVTLYNILRKQIISIKTNIVENIMTNDIGS